jgi:hypothetical protein
MVRMCIIIIIIISCYPLWHIGRQQKVAIWSYLWLSCWMKNDADWNCVVAYLNKNPGCIAESGGKTKWR